MKTRSSSGVGQKIDLEFNIDSLRITDCEQEESYGSGQASAGSSLLNQIKARQTVDATTGEIDPNTLSPIPKVRAQVESSKLRELLNNLPGDDI
jgi:hypothetical protein